MKKADPPQKALDERPRRDRSKFDTIAAALRRDPGTFYDITDDVPTLADKPLQSYAELARAITGGHRKPFRPKGAYLAVAGEENEGKQDYRVWAKYVGPADAPEPAGDDE